MTLQPNFSNTSSQEHSLSFSKHLSYSMPLLRTTPFVQLLLRIDTSWLLSQILYCSAPFSRSIRSHALYPALILCTTSLSHYPSADTCDQRYLKRSTSSNRLTVHRLVSHAFDPHFHSIPRAVNTAVPRPPTVQAWVYYAVRLINLFIFFSN